MCRPNWPTEKSSFAWSALLWVDILPEGGEYLGRMATQENNDDRIALLQGTLDLLILKTLVLGPCHGQGVARLIQRQSEEVFLVDHGSLYVALQRLEDKKWIRAKWGVSENNRKARFYSITPKGREQLVEKTERVAAADAGDGFDSGSGQRAAGRGGMSMFRRKRSAEDFAEEIKAHLELEADELRSEGLSEDEARWKARREFGNVRAAQERFYLKGRWCGWTSWCAICDSGCGRCGRVPGFAADGDSDAGAGNGREHGGVQRDECGAAAVAAGERSGSPGVSANVEPAPRDGHDRFQRDVFLSPSTMRCDKQARRAFAADGVCAAVGQQGCGALWSASRKRRKATW